MVKRLIKLFHKTKKINEPTKDQFLYQLSYQEQNEFCRLHKMSFKQAVDNLK